MWLFPYTKQGRRAIPSAPGRGPGDMLMRFCSFPSTEGGFHAASWRMEVLHSPHPSPGAGPPLPCLLWAPLGGMLKGWWGQPVVALSLWEQKDNQRLWLVPTGTGCCGQKASGSVLTEKHAALLASAARPLMVHLKAGVLSDASRAPTLPWQGAQRKQERTTRRLAGCWTQALRFSYWKYKYSQAISWLLKSAIQQGSAVSCCLQSVA